jgi:hypothetical protein
MNNESIAAAYESTRVFNSVAGNLTDVDAIDVDNQLNFIFEEMQETITAFEKGDAVETLDGACDLFVTVAGLMQKLESAGFNVEEALKRVCQNNMDKYIPVGKPLSYDAAFTATLNEEHNVWVICDSNHKIRKPLTFKSVNLSDLVPDYFFEGVA